MRISCTDNRPIAWIDDIVDALEATWFVTYTIKIPSTLMITFDMAIMLRSEYHRIIQTRTRRGQHERFFRILGAGCTGSSFATRVCSSAISCSWTEPEVLASSP